ncbi:MAG: TRAP transporter large permease subunit [Myxococcota bacterium]
MSQEVQISQEAGLPTSPVARFFAQTEHGLAMLLLGCMVVLSIINAVARMVSGIEVPSVQVYLQHFNLLLTFVGALMATRLGRHLTLSTTHTLGDTLLGRLGGMVGDAVGGLMSLTLAYASYELALAEQGSDAALPGGLKIWMFQMAMPVGFILIALRFYFRKLKVWQGVLALGLSLGLLYGLSTVVTESRGGLLWPLFGLLLFSSLLGAPMFVVMAGAGMLFFFVDDVPLAAVPAEIYHIVASPTLPVIPVFTFAGYLLAKGGASKRLIRLFNAWFAWMPGGVAVVTALVCAFFTTFTGASGITILGLGGLMMPMLLKAGYREAFAVGLITTAGSLGMLFPPSLPVILYGVRAATPIDQLFLGGILPGFFLMGVVIAYGIFEGYRSNATRTPFEWSEARASLWHARFELAMPMLLFSGIFFGLVNLGEAAALTVLYILIVETLITRELVLSRDLPPVMRECVTVVGSLLIIFGAALGLTNYMVDAEIPSLLTSWVQTHVQERWLFILALNVVLLVVGSLMEGLSAIVILVPLIAPIGLAFGFHPVHLGVLFLANLEVGFLLPPLGLNLFLSSIRFERPLISLYRPILPFLLLMFLAVLVISYVPELSLALLPDAPPVEPMP